MKPLKVGQFVRDADGVSGRILTIRRYPAMGQGHPSHEEVYVDWFAVAMRELTINPEALPEGVNSVDDEGTR